MTADIIEIFSSIQGEGIFLGAKQIFVRFKRCNMSCAYCDEELDRKAKRYSPLELMSQIKVLEGAQGPHHSISLTGGEPLLYAEFLKPFLKILWVLQMELWHLPTSQFLFSAKAIVILLPIQRLLSQWDLIGIMSCL